MRPRSLMFRLTTGVAVWTLLLPPVLPIAALAQPAPPPAVAAQQQGDPPEQVGRLASIIGVVSFHTTDASEWSPATVNYPVTTGDAFWTEPNAQAELQVGASRIQLAGGTEFSMDRLDESGLQATVGQGEVYLHLRGVPSGQVWTLLTPRGEVTLSGDGRYAITVGDTATPSTVTVLEGSAQVLAPNLSLLVGAGQAATITGTTSFQGSIGPAQPDAFITAMLQAEQAPPPAVAVPAAVEAMPGGVDLAMYGTWTDVPAYGPIWYPQVAAGWVPYREGHWAWVPPWGWTWIDEAPWGFAPFHYGRWIEIGGRWGWTPGLAAVIGPPVYAPALVTFFGLAAGVGIGAALVAGTIGWCPLGPREIYHPWYHASDRYLRAVNHRYVTNIAEIHRPVRFDSYVNRRAATMVPGSVMQASRPVRPAARPVQARAFTTAHPVVGRSPMAPTRATYGVTAATTRRTRLAPMPAGATAIQRAPGPAFRPTTRVIGPGAVQPRPGTQARPPLYTPQQRGAGPGELRAAPGGQPLPHVVSPSPHPAGVPQVRPEMRSLPRPTGAERPGTTFPSPPRVETPARPRVQPPTVQHPRPATEQPRPQVHYPAQPAVTPAPSPPFTRPPEVPHVQRPAQPQGRAAPRQHEFQAPPPQRAAPQHQFQAPPPQRAVPQHQFQAPPPQRAAPQHQFQASPPQRAAPQHQFQAPPPQRAAPQHQFQASPPQRAAAPRTESHGGQQKQQQQHREERQ